MDGVVEKIEIDKKTNDAMIIITEVKSVDSNHTFFIHRPLTVASFFNSLPNSSI